MHVSIFSHTCRTFATSILACHSSLLIQEEQQWIKEICVVWVQTVTVEMSAANNKWVKNWL